MCRQAPCATSWTGASNISTQPRTWAGFWLAARWRYGSTRRQVGMDSRERRQRIEALAHQIWEAEGRPDDQQ
ncbi:DUF2934 domain-containing protein, partial [Mycobacterium tuberculosis]|nr:DUF2934 domain-containing protein [Mycobacterium tuberculosis]